MSEAGGRNVEGASGNRAPLVVASAGADDRGMVGRRAGRSPRTTRKRRGSEQAVSRTFYRLADEPRDTILVACSKCDWKAAFLGTAAASTTSTLSRGRLTESVT
jgi:hypothetical protein